VVSYGKESCILSPRIFEDECGRGRRIGGGFPAVKARCFPGRAAEQEKKTPNPFDAWVVASRPTIA